MRRPVFLAHLESIADWPTLLDDQDWRETADDPSRSFGLFTASDDPAGESAWHDFADYCVQRDLALVSAWGPNSTILDDAFDMAAVMREVNGLPTSDPLTTWHDNETMSEALEFFLKLDLWATAHRPRESWDRIVLVVGGHGLVAETRRNLSE
jgi:hypothetical protein